MNPYTYEPLPQTTSIRLLHVHPDPEEEVKCSLITVDLEDAPLYNALSYTWGCPFWDYNFEHSEDPAVFNEPNEKYGSGRGRVIKCNGRVQLVTPNLFEALMAVRAHYAKERETTLGNLPSDQDHRPQHIWVDAICIDQSNISERNSQVAMMGRIYSSAKIVTVWLGEFLTRTSLAIDVLNALAAIPVEQHNEMRRWEPGIELGYVVLNTKPIRKPQWRVFLSFMRRLWFERLWVMQEIALSQNIVVLCGHITLEWDTIVRASQCLVNSFWHSKLTPFVFEGLDRLNSPLSLPGKSPHQFNIIREWMHEVQSEGSTLPLAHLLQQGRSYGTSDPKDRIYALLSLIPKLVVSSQLDAQQPYLIPNYNQDIASIFAEASWKALEVDQDLLLLQFIEDPMWREVPECPSWSPDWSIIPAPRTIFNFANQYWQPAHNTPYQAPILQHPHLLRIQAAFFDVVTQPSKQVNRQGPSPQIEQVIDKWTNWIMYAHKATHPKHQGAAEILWRTLILDVAQDQHPAPPDFQYSFLNYILLDLIHLSSPPEESSLYDLETYQTSLDALLDLLDLLRLADPASQLQSKEILQLMTTSIMEEVGSPRFRNLLLSSGSFLSAHRENMSNDRELLVTREGYLGCSSKSVMPGDEVWILPGARTPFVLRSLSNGHYQVINAAYIHGIMHGEAVESGQIVFEEIVLE